MAAIDSFLGFVIPLAVFAIFGFILYRAFGDEIHRLIRWLKKTFADKEEQDAPQYYDITYK